MRVGTGKNQVGLLLVEIDDMEDWTNHWNLAKHIWVHLGESVGEG